MLAIRTRLFPPDNRGVSGLMFFGWRGMIATILAGLLASFLFAGYWYPYWRLADMDLMMAYQGFLVNSGHPQDFFDHPGHLSILLTSGWFRLFHWLGFIEAGTLSQIPPAADAAAFDRVWTEAVKAGRLLSLVVAMAFVVSFALLLRRLVRDWQVAVLGTFCLAFSGGLMMNARDLRTDMLAVALVMTGFLIALLAARSPGSRSRPLAVGLAAALFTLGVINKVQALFLAIALVPVIPLFGIAAAEADPFWRSRRGLIAALAVAAAAALLLIAALPLIRLGLTAPIEVPPPFGVRGLYQSLIAGIVVAVVIVHAAVWRVPPVETAATLCAVAGGVALGLLALDLLYHPRNVGIVLNPVEHMFGWARSSDPKLGETGQVLSGNLLQSLVNGMLGVIARRTFVLQSSGRPTIVVEWFVLVGLVLAWRRGERRLFCQALALMLVAWGVDTVSTLRNIKIEYFLYADVASIIAAAWLLVHMPDLKTHRWAYAALIGLVAAHLALGQAGPIKHVFRKAGPEGECGWLPHYASRIERFPFCPPRAGTAPAVAPAAAAH